MLAAGGWFAWTELVPGPPGTVAITPSDNVALTPTARFRFGAQVRDVRGRVLGIHPVWTSEAVVDPEGLFTAPDRTGTYFVEAAVGSLKATAKVTVSPGTPKTVRVLPGDTTVKPRESVAFAATAFDEWGNSVPATPVWRVSFGAGSIDDQGIFVAGASGTSTVSAEIQGIVSSSAVTARCIPPARRAVDWSAPAGPGASARHEITHLFVDEIAARRLPVPYWLHEGLATLSEFPVAEDAALVSRYCTASAARNDRLPALPEISSPQDWRTYVNEVGVVAYDIA